MKRRAVVIVLDGVGIGAAPDAADYGDAGSDTLGNLSHAVGGLRLPNMSKLGLGRITPLEGVAPDPRPAGAWGRMRPASAGKDSTTGHWEICGIQLANPFPTYPQGFPQPILDVFAQRTGRGVIGNVAGSGTAIIDEYGPAHVRTGDLIVYTSADSVFQIAAHESVVPLEELYRACEIARQLLVAPHNVSRVIARPFKGEPGTFARTSNRRDYSIAPPSETLLDALADAGIPRFGIGKVDDLFARRSIAAEHTKDNASGVEAIRRAMVEQPSGFLFANLVDFDQLWGHRNDAAGFHEELRAFDRALPALLSALHEDDLLFLTADHGNDPTTPSTDHSREIVPLLVAGARVCPTDLGERSTFADLGATVAEWLGVSFRGKGDSFLSQLLA
jgi:phosphopentomutase